MLTLEEQETIFRQSALDRRAGFWIVYSDDAYWMRRLEAKGAEVVQEHKGGGRTYRISHKQLSLRNPVVVKRERKQKPPAATQEA